MTWRCVARCATQHSTSAIAAGQGLPNNRAIVPSRFFAAMLQAPAFPWSRTRRIGVRVFLCGELPLVPDGRMAEGIEAPTALVLACRAQ
jgi:enamine deaminase RidA (YjgF/YER057c/UK114 family)